jgi:hypothetical protein
MATELSDPIYIVGLDRSGKTTMRAFLSSHSRIAIPEVGSNMWTYFYRRFGPLDDPDHLGRCLEAMVRYKHVQFLEPDVDRIRREFSEGRSTYARLFALFLMHYAERTGKPRWGAQSGLVEQYADEIFEAFPGLKVIHMIRDPRDRYEASLARWPDGKGRAGGAAGRWRYSVRLAERNVRKHPNGYLVVRFEDLIESPVDTVRRVCRFLDEEFEPAMMAMRAAADFRRSLGTDAPEGDGAELLSPDYVGRFRGRVPRTELVFLQLHLRRAMRRYAYTPEEIRLSRNERLRFAIRDWPANYARLLGWTAAETAHRRVPRRFGHQPGRRMLVELDTESGADVAGVTPQGRSDTPSVAGS